jgi:hypothetical protein
MCGAMPPQFCPQCTQVASMRATTLTRAVLKQSPTVFTASGLPGTLFRGG